MVRNLKEAISLYNRQSYKLRFIDILQVEGLLSQSSYKDPNFLEFASLYTPLMKHHSKLFKLLKDESYLESLSLSDSMKVFDLLNRKFPYFLNPRVLHTVSNKVISAPDHKKSFDLSRLLHAYTNYTLSPTPEILSRVSKFFYSQPYRNKQRLLLPLYKCIVQLRLLENKDYDFLKNTYNRIHTEYIPELLKVRYHDNLEYYTKLCNLMCISQSWMYGPVWSSALSAVADKLEYLPSVKEYPVIHTSLLTTYEGLQTFAPVIFKNNLKHLRLIRSKLNYDLEYVQSYGHSKYQLKNLTKDLDERNVKYESNKIIDQLYNASIFIEPNKVLCFTPKNSYIREHTGALTNLEIGSKKYLKEILTAKGYSVNYVKFRTRKEHLDQILQ